MTTTQPTPDNIDRMLFQVLEETFTAEVYGDAYSRMLAVAAGGTGGGDQ